MSVAMNTVYMTAFLATAGSSTEVKLSTVIMVGLVCAVVCALIWIKWGRN